MQLTDVLSQDRVHRELRVTMTHRDPKTVSNMCQSTRFLAEHLKECNPTGKWQTPPGREAPATKTTASQEGNLINVSPQGMASVDDLQ